MELAGREAEVQRLEGNNVLAGAGFSATASGTSDGALGADMGGPSPDISAKLADRLMEQRGMTEKWKRRARQLGQQLALMSAGLAAQEAAAAERAAAGDRELEEQVVHFRAQVLRLQAELAGSEAARQQLEQPAAHDSLGQQSTGAAHLARTAELEARCLVLARQLDQEQVQAAGAGAALQEQVARLKASLAQEQGERARLLGSMREALAGLRGAGDGEGRLRSQLLDAHQCAASAQTAQAQAEACATGWREECNMLRQKLVMSEKELLSRNEHERQAMAVEARTRDQALAAIREGQASAAVSAAVLAAVESRYQAQLT
ncbi:uncharacterized protein HaLaN_19661, partial [Haematococcus lacustris]